MNLHIMTRISFTFIFLIFLSACSSTRGIKTLPSLGMEKAVISKGIDIKGDSAMPINPTYTYSTEDREVIASVKLRNLAGKHLLRWDWIAPDGNIYQSSGDYSLSASSGKYKEEVTAWHRLSIKGNKSAGMPGDWQVNIYLDDSPLESKSFKIEVDVEAVPWITRKPDPKKWGIIIAVEKYPNFPSVDYAEEDARLVKEYFLRILGVPEENLIFLLGNDATKSRIKGYLRSYLPKNIEDKTTLYVYYSGHGLPYPGTENIEPYLVPYDSDTVTITETGYRLKEFYEDIDSLNIKRAFVFIDACFSGAASRGDKMLIAGGRPVIIHIEDKTFLSGKLISMTSSSGGEFSNAYSEKGHGLFTYFLLRGLRDEADSDKNGSTSLEELYSFVRKNVSKVSRRKGMEQTPEIAPSLNMIKDVEINNMIK